MASKHSIVDQVASRIPPACVGSASQAKIRALAARLPGLFSSYYLECRLAAGLPQVDLLACVAAPVGEAELEQMRSRLVHLPSGRGWGDAWDVVRRWVAPEGAWYARMPFLWLEFDHAGTRAPTRQRPSICVCIDPAYPDRASSAARCRRGARANLELLTRSGLPALAGLVARRALVERCIDALPPGGRMIHLSMMTAREPAAIKLYGAIARRHLAGYLTRLGWAGDFAGVADALRSYFTRETADDTVYFDLAIEGALLPYVGLAYSQLQLAVCGDDAGRGRLLRLLARRGLCAPSKRSGLAAWGGCSREANPSGAVGPRIWRWLDAKVCLSPGRGPAAKAYLGFAPIVSVF